MDDANTLDSFHSAIQVRPSRLWPINMTKLSSYSVHARRHRRQRSNNTTPNPLRGPSPAPTSRSDYRRMAHPVPGHGRLESEYRDRLLRHSPDPAAADGPETYLCTFCWRPQHSRVNRPRAVGSSARLACGPCHDALLDLAVCWVCGEVVLRGDECVSLGWCFWHRACYGCLMCGDRRVAEGVSVEELFERRDGAREIDEVPLCGRCVDDVVEGRVVDGEHLAPLAMERVDRFDGGLSRRRWEARQAGVDTCSKQEDEAAAAHCVGRRIDEQQSGERPPRAPSPIYVSMRNPLGEPAFRRSATKPIPAWMQYLPSQRTRDTRDCADRPASVLDDDHLLTSAVAEPPPPPGAVPRHASNTPATRRYSSSSTRVEMSRPFTFIREEHMQRPSSSRLLVAGHGKQVRFSDNSPPPRADDRGGALTPSASSEYLERYQIPARHDGAMEGAADEWRRGAGSHVVFGFS